MIIRRFHLFSSLFIDQVIFHGVGILVQFLDQTAVGDGCLHKGVLHPFGGDVGILEAFPVDHLHRAHAHGLTGVIHGHAGLLSALTSVSRCVCYTFDGTGGIVQTDGIIGKFANIAGHVAETVDCLIGVTVQLLNLLIHDIQTFAGSAHDGLDGIHLQLVLIEAGSQGSHGQLTHGILQPANQLSGNIETDELGYITLEGREQIVKRVQRPGADVEYISNHLAESLKYILKIPHLSGNIVQFQVFGSLLQSVETLDAFFDIDALLQLIKRINGRMNILFKAFVVEIHGNNALVHFAAHPITSFQASSAILSKIGRMAGLM